MVFKLSKTAINFLKEIEVFSKNKFSSQGRRRSSFSKSHVTQTKLLSNNKKTFKYHIMHLKFEILRTFTQFSNTILINLTHMYNHNYVSQNQQAYNLQKRANFVYSSGCKILNYLCQNRIDHVSSKQKKKSTKESENNFWLFLIKKKLFYFNNTVSG